MADTATSASGYRQASPLAVSVSVMLATIMVILDMTVVNVNLHEMMGALGANSDQITWVLTSYIVAEAVIIPLGGVLGQRFGRKNLMMGSVLGFMIASAACGQAHDLTEMVLFRIIQGVFAASIVPISQSIMVDTFPPEARGRAMAFWGIGIMLGPILGPTLGGFISDHLSWRWVFYINVPIGVLNLYLLQISLPKGNPRPAKADWYGAALLALGVGSLQAMLDQGNSKDWFHSSEIQIMAALAVFGLLAFVWRSWGRADAVLRLNLLKNRNLAASSFMIMTFGLGMFGTIALQPIMLSELFGYPPETTGLVMAPRGFATAIGMFAISNLITKVDARYLVAIGLVLAGTGSYLMSIVNLDANSFYFYAPTMVQGLGMGMMFVPLSTLAFGTLQKDDTDFASGIYNLARTIGSSIGISVAATVLTHKIAQAQTQLSADITPTNPAVRDWLNALHLPFGSPEANGLLFQKMSEQAMMMGFVHTFLFIATSFVFLFPLVFLLQGPKKGRKPASGGH